MQERETQPCTSPQRLQTPEFAVGEQHLTHPTANVPA